MKQGNLKKTALFVVATVTLSSCVSSNSTGKPSTKSAANEAAVTVSNCGKEMSLPGPARRIFVHDGNIIALALAAGAADEITAVSSVGRDIPILQQKYGEVVTRFKEVAKEYPPFESVLAADPDLMVAGWNYGFSEAKNLTPDMLAAKGIPSYILTESCRQGESTKRGVVDPWEAVRIDITNLGRLTGHPDTAKQAVDDIDRRLGVLESARKPETRPTVFVFDSVKDAVFTSGSFGAPEAIITAAGGRNATADVKDTWTTVSWERLATSKPDLIALVDYPGQTYDEKVKILKEHPATKDLPAVVQERFVNLPYAMWTESPMNIDAAEYLRKSFEKYALAPPSGVTTGLTLPRSLPGRDKLP